MLKAILMPLSLAIGTSATAAISNPQLHSIECRADNGVTLQTVLNPRFGTDKVTVESRLGFVTKTFGAKLSESSGDVSAITLQKDGEIQYTIAMQLDLTSEEEQIGRAVIYGSYPYPYLEKVPRVIAEARCQVILKERLP